MILLLHTTPLTSKSRQHTKRERQCRWWCPQPSRRDRRGTGGLWARKGTWCSYSLIKQLNITVLDLDMELPLALALTSELQCWILIEAKTELNLLSGTHQLPFIFKLQMKFPGFQILGKHHSEGALSFHWPIVFTNDIFRTNRKAISNVEYSLNSVGVEHSAAKSRPTSHLWSKSMHCSSRWRHYPVLTKCRTRKEGISKI